MSEGRNSDSSLLGVITIWGEPVFLLIITPSPVTHMYMVCLDSKVSAFMDNLVVIQILLIIPISIPFFYWLQMKILRQEIGITDDSKMSESEIIVILPMKNEEKNVERKISSVIPEILSYDSANLIVADSNSTDGTFELARSFLESSELDENRWDIVNFSKPGKNVALNGVIGGNDSEIVVISDADANVSTGWLGIVRSRLDDEEIGVVSGIENVSKSGIGSFSSYYRRKSNHLRIIESEIDSTPVLEGSLLAWRRSALEGFRFSEKFNADDAQLCLSTIRRGYRAIVDSRITFEDFELRGRTFSESIRRAQGLSIALIKSADLAIVGGRKKARRAVFNAIALYVFFPWAALFFTINSIIALYISQGISNSWESYSVISIFLILLTPQGRSLAIGTIISNVAHVQAIIGKRYNKWEPVR